MGRLDGKVAVVTGAGSGMGRAGAVAFAREGAAVVLAEIDPARAEHVAATITAAGGRALVVPTDVTSGPAVAAMVARAVAELGSVDVLASDDASAMTGGIHPVDAGYLAFKAASVDVMGAMQVGKEGA